YLRVAFRTAPTVEDRAEAILEGLRFAELVQPSIERSQLFRGQAGQRVAGGERCRRAARRQGEDRKGESQQRDQPHEKRGSSHAIAPPGGNDRRGCRPGIRSEQLRVKERLRGTAARNGCGCWCVAAETQVRRTGVRYPDNPLVRVFDARAIPEVP